MEGYFDAIALANAGVRNAVAGMGTALPLEQLRAAAEMGDVPGGESPAALVLFATFRTRKTAKRFQARRRTTTFIATEMSASYE